MVDKLWEALPGARSDSPTAAVAQTKIWVIPISCPARRLVIHSPTGYADPSNRFRLRRLGITNVASIRSAVRIRPHWWKLIIE